MTALVVALLLAQHAPGREGLAPLAPAEEARVMRLGKEIRCAVCQGLSIADSPASMARAQLDKVRELVAEGKSDDDIKTYFVARYGEWALLRPRPRGLVWALWFAPIALLAVGLWVLRSLRQRVPEAPPPAPRADTSPDALLAQVRRDTDT